MEYSANAFELWCKEFEKYDRNKGLSKEDTELILKILLNPKLDKDDEFNKELIENDLLYAVLSKRLLLFDYTMSIRAKITLSILCTSLGDVVMYLTYLQYYCFINKIKDIDINILIRRIFPLGSLNKDDLNELWHLQKTKDGNNMLDNYNCMTSIRF